MQIQNLNLNQRKGDFVCGAGQWEADLGGSQVEVLEGVVLQQAQHDVRCPVVARDHVREPQGRQAQAPAAVVLPCEGGGSSEIPSSAASEAVPREIQDPEAEGGGKELPESLYDSATLVAHVELSSCSSVSSRTALLTDGLHIDGTLHYLQQFCSYSFDTANNTSTE